MPGMGLWAGFVDGRVTGWWLLRPRSHQPGDSDIELGHRLLRRFRRRGLAGDGSRELIRHAFDDLGASRVCAEALAVAHTVVGPVT